MQENILSTKRLDGAGGVGACCRMGDIPTHSGQATLALPATPDNTEAAAVDKYIT